MIFSRKLRGRREVKVTKIIVNLTIQGTIDIPEGGASLVEEEVFGKVFGKELRLRRLTRELTMVRLGKLSGVSPSHIGRIERGERAPSYEIAMKLKRALEEGK